jgi:coenzyme PQQ precursor peptide PqqA
VGRREYRPQLASKCPTSGRHAMAWKSPRIVEIAVGMEINSYACADLA